MAPGSGPAKATRISSPRSRKNRMKNELHPWEVGIAEQIKGKEFSFDPQAFADFEQLLEAEALGQLPGEQAPKATGETMSSGGLTISLPTILLVIGLACLAGWWLWPTVDNEAATALPSTSSKELTDVTSSALPSILPAPAAAPSDNTKAPSDFHRTGLLNFLRSNM